MYSLFVRSVTDEGMSTMLSVSKSSPVEGIVTAALPASVTETVISGFGAG